MENQPTKLDKATKFSIIAGVLIVAVSIAYYLVYFLPHKYKVKIEAGKECSKEEVTSKYEKCLRGKGF